MNEQRFSHHPPRVAITGGIGSGKSTALAFLRELGAATLSADDVVHAMYADAEVQAALERRFDASVVHDGIVNREALAALVFQDYEALTWLEQLTHPHVRRIVEEWAARNERAAHSPALLAVEIPLLFESGGMAGVFDCVLLITAPTELRRRRAAAKFTAEEFDRRMARQLDEATKAEQSHFVYENTGSRRRLKEFVAETFAAILAIAAMSEEEAR